MKINKKVLEEISKAISSDLNFGRGNLKLLLLSFMSLKSRGSNPKSENFFDYAIKTIFSCVYFHIIKIIDHVIADYGVKTSLREIIQRSDNQDVTNQYNNFIECKKLIRFYQKHPEKKFRLWSYSRIFEERCFLNASVYKNRALISFSIGLLGPSQEDALKMYALSEYKSEAEKLYRKGLKIRSLLKRVAPSDDEEEDNTHSKKKSKGDRCTTFRRHNFCIGY